MNNSGATAVDGDPTEGCDANDSAPLTGVEYPDAWRAVVRTFPGSVPPLAGFFPVEPDDDVSDGDVASAVIAAVAGIAALGSIDPATLQPRLLAELVEGVEQVRRMLDAAATAVAGSIDHRNPLRTQGYFNAKTFLKQRAQLSGPEAYRRIQTAHMRDRLAECTDAARRGVVGVAQSEAIARATANPRIEPDVLARDAGVLLDDAMNPDPNTAQPTASNVTADVLLEHDTMQAHASGTTPDTRRFRNVVCRTQSGRRLHPDDTVNMALVGHIRRVVYDTSGTVIDLGRRSRLFSGSARDAVMLLPPPMCGSAAIGPLPGATPTTHSAGKPTAPPCPATANHCAPATRTRKKPDSRRTATTTATGTSPTPTATTSSDAAPFLDRRRLVVSGMVWSGRL